MSDTVYVVNLKDTSDDTRDIPWLKYWELRKGKIATRCSNIDCEEPQKVDDGGHVKYSQFNSHQTFIVPLCDKCNNSENESPFPVYYEDLLEIS